MPAQDDAKSKLTISGVPANQGILDLKVLVTISHPVDGDLDAQALPALRLPAGDGPQFITLAQNEGQRRQLHRHHLRRPGAARSIAAGPRPFTRPRLRAGTASLRAALVDGKSPNGTWTLEIDDTRLPATPASS